MSRMQDLTFSCMSTCVHMCVMSECDGMLPLGAASVTAQVFIARANRAGELAHDNHNRTKHHDTRERQLRLSSPSHAIAEYIIGFNSGSVLRTNERAPPKTNSCSRIQPDLSARECPLPDESIRLSFSTPE